MAHALSIYLPEQGNDPYQSLYDEVARLNGDYEAFPSQFTSFHGQDVQLRESNLKLKQAISLANPGKNYSSYMLSDAYSNYNYLNYIAVKCWIDFAIDRSPASINHLSKGFLALSEVELSENAFRNEKSFAKEISSNLASIIQKNTSNQRVWLSIRMFANYAIENAYWGFDESIIFKLDEIKIPNSGGKIRVSLLDHENGPFTRTEVAQIAQAIHKEDVPLQTRVCFKLAMQFGLRPIQIALLREDDVYYDDKLLAWFINIPRVKGRTAQLRRNKNNFVLRELPTHLAQDITELNKLYDGTEKLDFEGNKLPRPLLKADSCHTQILAHKRLKEYAWHLFSEDITRLFSLSRKLLNIQSRYILGEDGNPTLLKITCYRFRYTLGTRMVMEGKTLEEVAIALDHSSVASIQHYFRYNRDLIDFIDDSFESSNTIKNAVMRWQGFIIDEDDGSVEGSLIRVSDIASLGKCLKKTQCEMHPTISCYSCSRFRPFKNANHEAQLKVIKAERDFVKANSSGAALHQLDEAWEGAIQIVEAIKSMKGGE